MLFFLTLLVYTVQHIMVFGAVCVISIIGSITHLAVFHIVFVKCERQDLPCSIPTVRFHDNVLCPILMVNVHITK